MPCTQVGGLGRQVVCICNMRSRIRQKRAGEVDAPWKQWGGNAAPDDVEIPRCRYHGSPLTRPAPFALSLSLSRLPKFRPDQAPPSIHPAGLCLFFFTGEARGCKNGSVGDGDAPDACESAAVDVCVPWCESGPAAWCIPVPRYGNDNTPRRPDLPLSCVPQNPGPCRGMGPLTPQTRPLALFPGEVVRRCHTRTSNQSPFWVRVGSALFTFCPAKSLLHQLQG